MRPARFLTVLLLAAFASSAAGVAAYAQQQAPGRGTTVTDRPRPETDPLGVRAGSFLIFPSAALTEQFRDNIFFDEEGNSVTPNDLQGDFITVFSPQLLIQSDWSNHELNLFGDADVGRFAINHDEDYDDWHGGANGRYDISRQTNVSARFDIAQRHESRGSPDDQNGKHPIVYKVYGPTVGVSHQFNRITIEGTGSLVEYNFNDVQTGINSVAGVFTEGEINNDDRDRREVQGSVQVSYEIVPNYDAFVRGSVNDREYDSAFDDNGFNRDSDGWEVVGGTAIDLTGVLFGNVFAGYRKQTYQDSRFPDVTGPGFGGDLTWNPTGLTTVNVLAERSVEESTLVGSSGFFASRLAAKVDHELLRNLIITIQGSFQRNDYDGNTREDDIVRAAAQLRYLMHRSFYITLGYDFQNRESSFINQNYTVNTAMIRLEAQL